jgi:hypothetical protein
LGFYQETIFLSKLFTPFDKKQEAHKAFNTILSSVCTQEIDASVSTLVHPRQGDPFLQLRRIPIWAGRAREKGEGPKKEELPQEVTPEVFSWSKKDKYKSRLCGDLRQYAKHEESIDYISSKSCKNSKK